MRSLPAGIGIGTVVAIALHFGAGWVFSFAGAAIAGLMAVERGWLAGLCSMVLSWGALMVWSISSASAESAIMMDTVAALMGGLPGFVTPVATLLMAGLPGAVLGWFGGGLRNHTQNHTQNRNHQESEHS